MRKKLKKLRPNATYTFTARVSRYGKKQGNEYTCKSVLLKNLKCGDEYMTDHVWATKPESFSYLSVKPGDKIRFKAKIRKYTKYAYDNRFTGNGRYYVDYGIKKISQVEKLYTTQ